MPLFLLRCKKGFGTAVFPVGNQYYRISLERLGNRTSVCITSSPWKGKIYNRIFQREDGWQENPNNQKFVDVHPMDWRSARFHHEKKNPDKKDGNRIGEGKFYERDLIAEFFDFQTYEDKLYNKMEKIGLAGICMHRYHPPGSFLN